MLSFSVLGCSEQKSREKVKSILLAQLKNTHANQEWFVPTNTALKGLSVEQSNWRDSTNNHSIAELTSHLTFWNEMNLKSFKGENMSDFGVDNELTFNINNEKDWKRAVIRLDSIQTEWENAIEEAPLKKLNGWSSEIMNMTAHNAYHTGQIIYIRKRNGWWK